MTKQQFGAVTPTNVRPPRATRRDPDAEPAPPPPSTAPTGPGPTDPTPPPPPAAPAEERQPEPAATPPPAAPPSAAVPAGGGTLATVLTAPNHQQFRSPVSEGVAALANLAQMAARPVDPMEDWAGDGTRTPRWIAAAVRQYAQLTGRKTQEVQRDALLGIRPIPDDVLDANWLNLYGYPREQYNPEAYR